MMMTTTRCMSNCGRGRIYWEACDLAHAVFGFHFSFLLFSFSYDGIYSTCNSEER